MEQAVKENSITQGVIWKQLLIFFFPILIGTFFQQLYNTVDTIVVGQYVGTNALAAVAAGTDEIDCGLLGMARSAGNCATELAAATLKKEGYLPEVDLYALLDYLDRELIPAMRAYDYHLAVNPTDLMLGLSGCHSNFLPMFRKVAKEEGVSLLKLIAEVSAIDRKAPPESLLREVAGKLK